jgi:tetrapyrrole methylase family protein/MazG family protein
MGEQQNRRNGRGIDRLLDVVKRLRGEGGCPWDREQTLDSLKPYLIEESYETLDALESGDPARHAEELGDVLLQIVLHAQIRTEEGAFTFDDLAHRLADKLIRRHPHVFGDVQVSGSREVLRNWETIKAREKKPAESILDGVPRHLPALQRAQRMQSRASRVGFDWARTEDVVEKVEEELAEVRKTLDAGDENRTAEEIGDLLFAVVNLSRFLGIHAEQALDGTIAKFLKRFRKVEQRVREAGRGLGDCDLAEMDAHWEAVKREERETRRDRVED